MALTFQDIKNSYDNSDLHIRAIKLPVPLVLEQNEFNLLHTQMWPDMHKRYASFDFVSVAKIKEHSTGEFKFELKGFFISLPGHDDFICANNMTDEDNTAFILSLFKSRIMAYFFTQNGTLITKMCIYDLIRAYFCYVYHIDNYKASSYPP